jgi:hypothetical protein
VPGSVSFGVAAAVDSSSMVAKVTWRTFIRISRQVSLLDGLTLNSAAPFGVVVSQRETVTVLPRSAAAMLRSAVSGRSHTVPRRSPALTSRLGSPEAALSAAP